MSYDHMVPDGSGGYRVYHHDSSFDYGEDDTFASKHGCWVILAAVIVIPLVLFFGVLALATTSVNNQKVSSAPAGTCRYQWLNNTDTQREQLIVAYYEASKGTQTRSTSVYGQDAFAAQWYFNECMKNIGPK